MNAENHTQECCPPFDPALWDEKELTWSNRIFIKTRVFCIFNMPVNFGGKMRKLIPMIDQAGATMLDAMALSDHTSMWNMNLLIAVDKAVPGIANVTLSGRFLFKVYEGPFQNTGRWCKDFSAWLKEKGKSTKKWYMWYTTCPKCAKKYGKNYVVIIGEESQ